MKLFNHHHGEYFYTAGAKIYYQRIGHHNAPALVMLHGGFNDAGIFNTLIPALSQLPFQLIGIDSRGQGRSTLGEAPLNYMRLQKDVEELLNHLGIEHCQLLGFSDGGIVGYRLAALSECLTIDRLATIGARWHIRHTQDYRTQWLTTDAAMRERREPEMYARYHALNPQPNFPHLLEQLTHMWLDPTSTGHPNEATLNIDCPLLIARGDHDRLIPRQVVFELAEQLENAQLLNVPFAKHPAFLSQTRIFKDILQQFFTPNP